MDAAYVEKYRRLYERHWWWRARERMVLGLVRPRVPEGGFGPILDVGCGDGLFFEALGAYGVPEGIEVDAGAVSEAGRTRGTIHVRPFDEGFEPDRAFGLILMLDVVEHLDDDVAALRHARRLLAAGGTLIVTVPALPCLWTRHDDLNHHRRRYTRRTLERALGAADLEVERIFYYFHWLVLPKLLVRVYERLRPPGDSFPEVPAEPVNRLLTSLSLAENALFERARFLPGSSLAAVAVAGSPPCSRGGGDRRMGRRTPRLAEVGALRGVE